MRNVTATDVSYLSLFIGTPDDGQFIVADNVGPFIGRHRYSNAEAFFPKLGDECGLVSSNWKPLLEPQSPSWVIHLNHSELYPAREEEVIRWRSKAKLYKG